MRDHTNSFNFVKNTFLKKV